MAADEIIVGLSLGYREEEGVISPGLSNAALAKAADREQDQNPELESILQWEIAECTKRKPIFTVWEHRVKGQYLDSDEVIAQVVDFIRGERPNVKTIRLLAYAFLHRTYCKKIIKSYGFGVKIVKTGWIPLDKKSAQWWTRNIFLFVIKTLWESPRYFFGRKE